MQCLRSNTSLYYKISFCTSIFIFIIYKKKEREREIPVYYIIKTNHFFRFTYKGSSFFFFFFWFWLLTEVVSIHAVAMNWALSLFQPNELGIWFKIYVEFNWAKTNRHGKPDWIRFKMLTQNKKRELGSEMWTPNRLFQSLAYKHQAFPKRLKKTKKSKPYFLSFS